MSRGEVKARQARHALPFCLSLLFPAPPGLAAGESLLPGDADGDGRLTLADPVAVLRSLVTREPLPCPEAADFTGNGAVQLGDAGLLIEHLLQGRPEAPGPIAPAGGDALGCQPRAEIPEPREAGAYALEVLPATGGRPGFRLRVSLANDLPAWGGRLTLTLPEGWPEDAVVLEARPSLELATSLEPDGIAAADIGADRKLRCLWLLSMTRFEQALAPRRARPLIEIAICPGSLPAADYPLEAADGELVSPEGALAIASTAGAGLSWSGEPLACEPPPPNVSTVRAFHYLSDAAAEPGSLFRVSVLSGCNIPHVRVRYRIRWDPDVVRVVGAEPGRETSHIGVGLGNPGTADRNVWRVILGAPEFPNVTFCDPCSRSKEPSAAPTIFPYYPRGEFTRVPFPTLTEMHHFDLVLEVLPDVPPGETWIEFIESGQNLAGADNYVEPFIPEGRNFIRYPAQPLLAARVEILPPSDERRFIRGDANRDGGLGLSDSITHFQALFLGTRELRCEDAADSNDDGRLDVSDGIYTLAHLFLGGPPPPPPFPAPGLDPTPDPLGCER
jgi:hypothetical protein